MAMRGKMVDYRFGYCASGFCCGHHFVRVGDAASDETSLEDAEPGGFQDYTGLVNSMLVEMEGELSELAKDIAAAIRIDPAFIDIEREVKHVVSLEVFAQIVLDKAEAVGGYDFDDYDDDEYDDDDEDDDDDDDDEEEEDDRWPGDTDDEELEHP